MKHWPLRLDDGAMTNLTQWGEHGPIMLCVHGMTSSRIGWRRLAEHYLDRFRVVAYDQRGHGESASVPGPMSIERQERDLENVAASLDGPVDVLVGHSWGGAVVIRGGSRIGAKRIVAIDPAVRQISATWYAEYLEELEPVFALEGPARDEHLRAEYAQAHPLDVEGKIHAMRTMTAQTLIGLRDQNAPGAWDMRDDIAQTQTPLFLALADPAESVVTREDFAFIEEQRNPRVTVEVFSGEGHSLHRSALERFCASLDRFIEQTSA